MIQQEDSTILGKGTKVIGGTRKGRMLSRSIDAGGLLLTQPVFFTKFGSQVTNILMAP
jgi:hypothetical protein